MRALLLVTLLTFAVPCAAANRTGTGLDGCLYWIDGTCGDWSDAKWQAEARAMRDAGLRHVIMYGAAEAVMSADDATHAASKPASASTPVLVDCDRFMRAANEAGLHVYLSLCAHPNWYGRWNLTEEIDTNRRAIALLMHRYASNRAFAGWYIPHEIYVMWGQQSRYMHDLYRDLSALCKSATPDRKVALSPFFILDHEGWLGVFRYATPKEYEDFWAELLAQTQIDIIAVQDSGEHLSCYTMDQRRPFLAAMQHACQRAGKTFWINIETGELDVASYEDFAQRFGRGTAVNDPKTRSSWRAVPASRLQEKLRLAHEFTDTTITWGYREYWDPLRGEKAERQYRAYLAQPDTQPAN